MASNALLFALGIGTFLSSCAAVCALACLRRVSRATSNLKPLASLEARFLELESAFEKASAALRKQDNRQRMREVRQQPSAPRPGAPKGELWQHYGFRQAGPAFAQHQLDMESDDRRHNLNGSN